MVKLLHMEGAGQPDQTVDRLFEQIKIINRMVVPNITEFRLIGSDKSEDDPVCLVDPEAPDLMMLGVQFLGMKRRVEGIAFEQVRFGAAFRWMVDGSFLKSRSNVAVVEISINGNRYSTKSRKDCLLVTLPARWSRSDASKASRNSFR